MPITQEWHKAASNARQLDELLDEWMDACMDGLAGEGRSRVIGW